MYNNQLENVLEENGILFLTYGGFFTQSLIAGMTEVLEKEVEEAALSMKISNNIFVVFIELSQNVMNYSKKLKTKDGFDPKGLIYVGKKEDHYFVESKNIISLSDKEKIDKKLQEIQKLSHDEIKKLYKEVRRSGRDSHSKGGGLGFLEIAKKVSSFEYEFSTLQEDKLYFRFSAKL
jgi:hypothetical protein